MQHKQNSQETIYMSTKKQNFVRVIFINKRTTICLKNGNLFSIIIEKLCNDMVQSGSVTVSRAWIEI